MNMAQFSDQTRVRFAPMLASVLAPALTWWAMRSQTDRRILIGSSVLLLALAVLAWLVLPAARGISDLERDLPGLRAQRAEVLAMAQEGRALLEEARSSAAVAPPAVDRRPALERSLSMAGLTGAEIGDDGANRVRLRWPRIDYGVWAAWVGLVERELAARVIRVGVQPPPVAGAPLGQVQVEMVLEWRAS